MTANNQDALRSAREAALSAANEACRNMEGELDLEALAQHMAAFAALRLPSQDSPTAGEASGWAMDKPIQAEVTAADLDKFERVIRLADTLVNGIPVTSAALGYIRVAYETLGLARSRLAQPKTNAASGRYVEAALRDALKCIAGGMCGLRTYDRSDMIGIARSVLAQLDKTFNASGGDAGQDGREAVADIIAAKVSSPNFRDDAALIAAHRQDQLAAADAILAALAQSDSARVEKHRFGHCKDCPSDSSRMCCLNQTNDGNSLPTASGGGEREVDQARALGIAQLMSEAFERLAVSTKYDREDRERWAASRQDSDEIVRLLTTTLAQPATPEDALRKAAQRILSEKAPGYHDCIDNGEPQCAWCDLQEALSDSAKAGA